MIRFCKLIPVFCNNSTRAPYPKVEKVEGGTASAALVGAEGARPSPPPPASPEPDRCVSIPKNSISHVLVGQQPRVYARWVEQLGAHDLHHGLLA